MSANERLLIEVVGGSSAPAELPRAGALVIGSDAKKAGVLVEGPEVDAAHCVIGRAKGGGWALRDLGSHGGTFVNGARVATARLSAGDVLRVGGRELRIVDPAAAVASTPRVPADDETRGVELETPISADLEASSKARAAEDAALARELPTIAGYRVERPLGRGGMGRVFLAVQESLARPVALKLLAPKLAADAEFVRRFQAEARAAAALNHPNVVTVYDVGEARGVHYLSMEYMDQGTLEDRIAREGRLPWKDVLEIARDAALGLAFAESRNIVHRDLKPANLMRNSAGQTKIADLGLATHVEAEEQAAADRKVFGTPHFMSPEQARGERVDGRSDLYSLGATMYRLLTGHTPFEGANAKEIVRAHLREEPRSMRDFVADLPEGVIALVARLMQKEPAARFASANEFARELERVRSGPAASAPRERATAGSGSRKLVWLVLLLALGVGGWFYLTGEGKPWLDALLARANDAVSKPDVPRVPDGQEPMKPVKNAGEPAATSDGVPAEVKPPREPKKPVDDDAAEQALEEKARLELAEIEQRELGRPQRRDELRALAGRYAGTAAATEAWQKAEAIASELIGEEQTAVRDTAARDDIVTRLRSRAGLDKEPPEPGKALLALRAVEGQEALALDPLYATAKKELEREIMTNAVLYAQRVLAQYDQLASKGDFDAGAKKLEALLPVFDLPEFPLGEGPAGVAELFQVGRTVRERLKTLELTRVKFVEQKTQEDTRQIAVTFGGPDGLESELRVLDLVAARARVAAAANGLATDDSKAWMRELEAELGRAREALDLLAREFGTWRRKSFTDPRDKKASARNAVGVDAGGLLVEGEGGKVERIDWSQFGGRPADLARLFHERLAREYTTEEVRGIAALLRIAGVIEAVDLAAKMLDPARKANFTDANQKELLEAFAPATLWSQRSGDLAAANLEIAAATQLCSVLQRVTVGAWSVAVDGTEALLSGHQTSLLVRLLSDGSLELQPSKPKDG